MLSDTHPIYIYSLMNLANDRRYIGSTSDMERRLKQHKAKPPTRMRSDWAFRPFDVYFTMTCLETVYSQAASKQAAYRWIRHYDTQAAARYNTCKGAPTTNKRFWFLRRLGVLR